MHDLNLLSHDPGPRIRHPGSWTDARPTNLWMDPPSSTRTIFTHVVMDARATPGQLVPCATISKTPIVRDIASIPMDVPSNLNNDPPCSDPVHPVKSGSSHFTVGRLCSCFLHILNIISSTVLLTSKPWSVLTGLDYLTSSHS